MVCPAAELPPGGRKLVTVEGREIGVFNVEGWLHALSNRCPHGGAAICAGTIVGLSLYRGRSLKGWWRTAATCGSGSAGFLHRLAQRLVDA